jgi:CBS domain-containing protein
LPAISDKMKFLMPTRLVREVCRRRTLVSADPDMTVSEAARLMAAEKIGALPVLRDGRLIGIFSERDAVIRVLAPDLDPDTTLVAQVMTADPVTINGRRTLRHAMRLMHDGHFRHVPVVEDGNVIGIVSVRDALDLEMAEFETQAKKRNDSVAKPPG